MSNISNSLKNIDRFCNYIPVASSVTNFVNLVEKAILKTCCSSKTINENRYFSYIVNEKRSWKCAVLLVPLLGNVTIAVCDITKKCRKSPEEREYLKQVEANAKASRNIKSQEDAARVRQERGIII